MPMPEKTCTHGTSFVLECSVAVSSLGHGGQVSVSPFPQFHSVVLPLESLMTSRIYRSLVPEAILTDNIPYVAPHLSGQVGRNVGTRERVIRIR